MSIPFVTSKIAHGYMIQRRNEWLSENLKWTPNVFEGLAFETTEDAESVLKTKCYPKEKVVAKFNKDSGKGKPVPHKILSARGNHLIASQVASQCSSLSYGKSAVVGQNGDGEDIVVKIGQHCPKCRFRVRGMNHAEGAHHKGIVHKHSRR